jgi:hypothetical protein
VPEQGVLARYPMLAQPRETRLWTRGDRFWMESTNPERHWAWGRDDQGCLWLSLAGRHGVRFEADETPEGLAIACDVLSMQVETLLEEVLSDFQLSRETGESLGPVATHRIRAEPKAGAAPPGLRGAVLDIDTETRVLRRLVLHRARRGMPVATVTFTLVDNRPQADASYTLEGHLRADAPVFSRDNMPWLLRAQRIGKFFGASLGGPIR